MVVDQKGTTQEDFADPLDNHIPSLRKIRKLAGMSSSFCFCAWCLIFL